MLPVVSCSVAVYILRKCDAETQVLLLRRTDTLAGMWCQIAGSIERGETAWQTALREVQEETGITLDTLWSANVCEQFYEPLKNCITMVPVFVGYVSHDIQVILNQEHDAYEWVSFARANEMLGFSGQKRVLAAIKTEFVDQQPNPYLRIDINENA